MDAPRPPARTYCPEWWLRGCFVKEGDAERRDGGSHAERGNEDAGARMRYFLIDKVTELVVGERVRGVKNVTLSDEILHDHFPDYPIMPGALILEAASQLAGFLLEVTVNKPGGALARALLVQIEQAKFHDTSGPGDQLDIVITIDSLRETAAQVTAQVNVGDKRIARAALTFVLKKIDSDPLHNQRRYLYKLWTRDLKTPIEIL